MNTVDVILACKASFNESSTLREAYHTNFALLTKLSMKFISPPMICLLLHLNFLKLYAFCFLSVAFFFLCCFVKFFEMFIFQSYSVYVPRDLKRFTEQSPYIFSICLKHKHHRHLTMVKVCLCLLERLVVFDVIADFMLCDAMIQERQIVLPISLK